MNETYWQNITLQQAMERIENLETIVAKQIIDSKKLIKEKLVTETEGPATYYVNWRRNEEDIDIGCIKDIYKLKGQLERIQDMYAGYYVYALEYIDIEEEDDEPESFESRSLEDIFMVINNNSKSNPEHHKDYSIKYKIIIEQKTRNGSLRKEIMEIEIKQSFFSRAYRGFSIEWIPLQKERLFINTDYNFIELIKIGQYYVDKEGIFYTEEEVFKFC
ncbi:hypothetical protein KQI41_17520 [Tissierella pigra]|uniref:hypothetical protein n=1 Tax=Tissierella pigra TaxID=2607614 RepID=UPI001C0FEBA3|nr:hypothetical protein [Tissierella pigra]MBU5428197.1 hypothetical protein [Tissierella pigra]